MARYCLEWRSPLTVGEAPSLALSSAHDCVRDLADAAQALVAAGRAHDGAFRVSELRADGSTRAMVATDIASVRAWSLAPDGLPGLASTAWTVDDERVAAGLEAASAIRRSLNRAVRAGTLDLRQALRLAGETSRLLDPDVD